ARRITGCRRGESARRPRSARTCRRPISARSSPRSTRRLRSSGWRRPRRSAGTHTGAVLGTPAYMSPEQAQGAKAVDHRADLWSLAVIAFLCLTGEHPFVADTFGDLLLKIVVQPLPVPSEIWPDAPPGLDRWWARAAERDPARRFQSARELVLALAAALRP